MVHPARQLRLLRLVGPAARLAPRARQHDRVGVGAVGRGDRRRPRAPAPDAGRRGGAAAAPRVVQVLRVLRAQRHERVRVPRAPSAAAAAAGAPADRHLVLHVHGDQLRRRRLALRDPGVAVARRLGVPLVLPAPDRRSDRPRRGADPPDPASARRGPDRRVAGVVPDRRRAVQEDGDLGVPREPDRGPGVRRPEHARRARGPGRDLRVRDRDLRRLQRVQRHRDRRRAAARVRVPRELRPPVHARCRCGTSGGGGT